MKEGWWSQVVGEGWPEVSCARIWSSRSRLVVILESNLDESETSRKRHETGRGLLIRPFKGYKLNHIDALSKTSEHWSSSSTSFRHNYSRHSVSEYKEKSNGSVRVFQKCQIRDSNRLESHQSKRYYLPRF